LLYVGFYELRLALMLIKVSEFQMEQWVSVKYIERLNIAMNCFIKLLASKKTHGLLLHSVYGSRLLLQTKVIVEYAFVITPHLG